MPDKELDFVSYNRITSKSDAFVTSEELNCFVQYLPSTRATSYNIKKDQHTAGTTEDFSDYNIPDVSSKISPKKLRRINPFHKNNSESLLLNKFNTDPDIIYPTVIKEVKTKKVDYSGLMLNPEQLEFLLALQNVKNQSAQDNNVKLNIDEFSVIDEKVANSYFQLDPRFSEITVSSNNGASSYIDDQGPQLVENPQVQEYIKKFGFNPDEVNLKKKFEVRTGNAKDKPEINQFLQFTDKSEPVIRTNIVNNLSSINNNNLNSLNISVDKSTGNLSNIRNIKTNNYRHELNFSNETQIKKYNNEIKLSNNITGQDINIDDLHKRLLAGLNQSSMSNEFNYFTQVKSAKNYNIFEFKEILNLTERVSNNTNYVSLSTYYEHYRTLNNNYSMIKNSLNFTNNQVDYLTKISFNNKNTINQLFRTQNTYRNSILNMINNITKVQKLVFNENDNQFKAGLVKTINSLNRTNIYKIDQIREDLNISKINMTFMSQRMFRYEISKIEQTKKELNNLLNITNENNLVSNLFSTKLGTVLNQNNIQELINLSNNEKQIENINYLLKQSSTNINAVKTILDILNISRENNFEISKFNSNSIKNINTILNLSKNINATDVVNKISKNVFETDIVNLTNEEINRIQNNQNILKNINLSNIENVSKVAQSYSKYDLNSMLNVINVLDKNFKISNINLSSQDLKQLNLITEKVDINKVTKISNKLSKFNINNIEDVEQVSFDTKINNDTINKINVLDAKVQKISENNFINNIQQKEVYQLVNMSEQIKNVTQKISNISKVDLANNISKINNISSKITNNEFIENINLLSSNIQKYNLPNLKLSSQNIDQINNVLNIFTNNKTDINKFSKVVNNKYLQNLNQSFVDKVDIFETKISSFADKSKLKETIENLNITNKNFNSIFSGTKVSQIIKKNDLKQNIQEINIFEAGKNSTIINKYSFESNKKNIQNLYSELNLVQQNKIERRTSQNISQVYNELNQVNKEIKQELRSILKEQKNIVKSSNNFIKAISKSQNLGQQNLYDYLSFTNYSSTNKISNLTKYGDYNQVYNLLNVSKITENVAVNKAIKKTVNETIRLTQKTEKISFDIHKVNNEKVFKIFNTIKSTTNNYHEQREAEQKQEKLIEKKVDQLLTNKIELVTNNLVKNVLTKNEFDSIKRDIVYEILKVQNSTDEKLEQFKRETQQTVQTMLDKFLRS